MGSEEADKGPLQLWADKIGFEKRVKAVCKPCWELKYCPYGPLVEDFPLKGELDEKSCRIFGHDCPVFYVAEPLTETKELRNINRSIPRTVQFRVLKRDNQICQVCGRSTTDDDVHFDHVIPWSKGGSSEENNIRLLCSPCNLKRGNRFETEFLVDSMHEHLSEPVDSGVLDYLFILISFSHDFSEENEKLPSEDIALSLAEGKKTGAEEAAEKVIDDVHEFFKHPSRNKLNCTDGTNQGHRAK